MERYRDNTHILPSIVERGIHRIVTSGISFGRLVPSEMAYLIGSWKNPAPELINLLGKELEVDFSKDLIERVESLFSRPDLLLTKLEEQAAEDYFWGNKATNNLVIKKVFAALAFGELEFWERDLPQKSHEERLTGHILSKIFSSVSFSADAISDYSLQFYRKAIPIEVAYHDLSTNNREKHTGSDFGIIIHTNLPDQQESVRGVAIQAKKLGKNFAYLPILQAQSQISFANEGAYCCFYDMHDRESRLPPAILSTQKIIDDCGSTKDDFKVKRDLVKSSAIPLSLFLIQVMEGKHEVKEFGNIRQAANFMLRGEQRKSDDSGPSRVLTISIGGMSYRQELDDLKNLFGSSDTEYRD